MSQTWWIEVDDQGCILQMTDGAEPRPMFGGTVHNVPDRIDASRAMYVDGNVLDIGPRPSVAHFIDPAARAWIVRGKTELEVAQDAKWVEIRDERDLRETGGFPYLGKIFDSDSRSVQRITTAVQSAQAAIAAGVLFEIGWTCADNSVITLDAPQMIGVPVALAQYGDDLHCIARDLRAQIEACGTVEDVAAIAWPT